MRPPYLSVVLFFFFPLSQITVICLGKKDELKDRFHTLDQLKNVIFEKFRTYLTKKNLNEQRVNFILTYRTNHSERLLDDINIIKNSIDTKFTISVKRVKQIF